MKHAILNNIKIFKKVAEIKVMKKIIFILSGFITFGLGTLGIFLPILPTTVFYIVTAFLWMRSSDRLYAKFIQSSYYQKYIQESLVEKKITFWGKVKLFSTIFIVFLIPCLLVQNQMMTITLSVVFVLHFILLNWYFNKKTRVPLEEEK